MTVLIGAWRHGTDIQTIWNRAHPNVELPMYDDDPKMGCLPPSDLNDSIILGMNNPHDRQDAAVRWQHLPAAEPLVDPSTIIGERVRMANGVVIAPQVLLLQTVQLGPHVHLNYGVSMTRCHVMRFTTIAPGVTICGDVEIGKNCMIGAGATIANCVTIGHNVVIGAGAVIPPFTEIPDGETWVGVPAKKIGTNEYSSSGQSSR